MASLVVPPQSINTGTATGTSEFATGYTGSTGQQIPGAANQAVGPGTIGANGLPVSLNYQPKTVNTTYETQTSGQDIEALVNSAMQQLVGRFATPQEIQMYGAELLAAEKANPNIQHSQLNYDQDTAKPFTQTGSMLTQGVDAQSFISNLIAGSGDAKGYKVATQYMDAIQQANQEYKGAYNG